jgi:hypothetical protein
MLPSAAVEKVNQDLARFKREWQGEIPVRIHQRQIDSSGAPAYSSEFLAWLNREWIDRDDMMPSDIRLRLTRVLRHLRDIAPREHDVMRRVLAGETTEEIRDWLNDRAERGGHPERYSLKDTVVLIVSGADKIAAWY